MNKKGFTLVETILALFLLGLIAMTILPITQLSYNIIGRNNRRLEMMQIGEMTVEKLKAFKETSTEELYIYNSKVRDIIDLFNSDVMKFHILEDDSKIYTIKISKEEKNVKLWAINVLVSYKKGETYDEVEYKALLPRQ